MAEAEINSSKRSFHGEWPRLDLFFLYINKKNGGFYNELSHLEIKKRHVNAMLY